jgi:subtilisin-like proprotein convertase family protein
LRANATGSAKAGQNRKELVMSFGTNRRAKRPSRRNGRQAAVPNLLPIEALEERRLLAGGIAVPQTFPAGDLPKQIVGNTTISSSIDVTGVNSSITDINVTVNLTHPHDGNLTLTLVSPSGTYLKLADQAGGTGLNFTSTVFDDQASTYIGYAQAPFTGSFQPQQYLTQLNGEQADGTWTLQVKDGRIGEVGSLRGFSITIVGGGQTNTYATTTAQNIPDATIDQFLGTVTPGTLSTVIPVQGSTGLISNIKLRLSLTDPVDSDLTATLISPAGDQVLLFDQVGGTGHDFINTKLDDYADDFIDFAAAPFTGTFRPSFSLSSLYNQDANGDWTLLITDNSPGATGKLLNAQLVITTTTGTGQIQGYAWNDANRDGTRPSTVLTGANPDVMYVIDVSGSTELPFNGTSVGDVNNDGLPDTVLDGELAGFIALTRNLIATGYGNANISIDVFADTAVMLDMNLAAQRSQLTTTASADNDNNGTPDVIDVLSGVIENIQGIGGNTSYKDAFDAAVAAFNTEAPAVGDGTLIFMSDGAPNPNPNPQQPDSALYQPQVNVLKGKGITLHAYGAGPDASLPALQIIDPGAAVFATTDELIDTFSGSGGLANFGETGLAGQTVYIDLNDNGQLDVGEPSAVTNGQGNYRLFGIPAGTYTVRQVVQPTFGLSAPVGGLQTVTLADGEIAKGINFGDFQSHGTISGYAFNDGNGDGIRETDLVPGVSPDVAFVVDASAASLLPMAGATVGDVNGDGSPNTILDVEISGYINLLQDMVARGMGITSKMSVIAYGGVAKYVDLSGPTGDTQVHLHPSTDGNGNDIDDVEEILKSIRPVRLNLGPDSNFQAALALADNAFTAMGTAHGNGVVIFMAAAAPPAGTTYDTELASLAAKGVAIRAFAVGLTPFPQLQQIDAAAGGFTTAGDLTTSFGGIADNSNVNYVESGMADMTVYLDLNNNGTPDVDEPSATTDTQGLYSFVDLDPGTYTVRQVLPPGFITGSPISGSLSVSLVDGQVASSQNFADGQPTAVGGSVYNDLNRNGQYDFEPLLQGVTVYIDLNNNSAVDAGEPQAVTDNTGYWEIDNLPGGHYFIRQDTPAGFSNGNPGTGSYETTVEAGAPLNDNFDFADRAPIPRIAHMAVNGVPDGSSPSPAAHTNFGKVRVGATVSSVFTLRNSGNLALRLTGRPAISISGPGKKDFKLTLAPQINLVPGSATRFKLTFKPTATGVRNATIMIPSNDPDTNPYTFTIRGTGLAAKARTAPKAQPAAIPLAVSPFAAQSSLFSSSRIVASNARSILD